MAMPLPSHSHRSEIAFASKFQPAFALLLEASRYAEETSRDLWEYAIEIDQFWKVGLSDNDLRYLTQLKYLDHASEVTARSIDGRQFRPSGNLSFTNRSCFVLSPAGLHAAMEDLGKHPNVDLAGGLNPRILQTALFENSSSFPIWDPASRILLFDGKIVKRFKWHAMNQELVLAAFQEEHWPMRIDDPLAPQPAQVIKRRLSDTIKCLNRGQEHKLIHFRGDGTGEGVIWESVI